MTAQAKKAPANKPVGTEVAKTSAKPPYPFRTAVSLILLAGNILVAAIYFHLVNP
jgi:photosystem I protein